MDHLVLGHLDLSSPEIQRTLAIKEGMVHIEWLDSAVKHLTANQCKERPQITPLNLHSWFRCNCWWVDLMAIEDKLVWVVGHYHLYTWVKGVENFSNHPTDYERLHRPRHGWRDRYLYFTQQMIWLNAASYCTQRYAVNCLLGTRRVQASIYSGLVPAANCRIKEDVKHVYFFSWVCCRCSWKGNRKLVPLFPRKPTKGVISSLSIIDRIYASIATCIFIEVLGIKHYFPQNHLIWIMMNTDVQNCYFLTDINIL